YPTIKQVVPGNVAAQSGLISAGDQLLEVNGTSMKRLPHEAVIAALNESPQILLTLSTRKLARSYKLQYDVSVRRGASGYGMKIKSQEGDATEITDVIPGGPAQQSKALHPGDAIVQVMGRPLQF